MSCWTSAPVIVGSPASRFDLQPVDELGAQDVDLAVQQAAPVGDLALLVGQLLDQVLELLVAHRPEVREMCLRTGCSSRSRTALAGADPPAGRLYGHDANVKLSLSVCVRLAPGCVDRARAAART